MGATCVGTDAISPPQATSVINEERPMSRRMLTRMPRGKRKNTPARKRLLEG
jgi:hypothetical protein